MQHSEVLVPILEEDESKFSGVVYCAKQPAGTFNSPNNPPLYVFTCVEAGRLIPPTSESCGQVRQVSFYTSVAYGRTSFGIECIDRVDGDEKNGDHLLVHPIALWFCYLAPPRTKNHFGFLR